MRSNRYLRRVRYVVDTERGHHAQLDGIRHIVGGRVSRSGYHAWLLSRSSHELLSTRAASVAGSG